MKKTLAILLSLALVICMIPGMAFAETYDGVSYAFKSGYETEFLYNGSKQVPTLTIDRTEGGTTTTLEEGKYTLRYSDGATQNKDEETIKDAKTYTVEAWSTSEAPKKLCSAQFTIKPVDLTRATITLTGDLTTAHIDSTKAELNSAGYGLVRVMQDGKALTVNTDYTLDSKVVGSTVYITATAKASGTNILASSKEAAFTIKTVLTDLAIENIPTQYYTGEAIKPAVSVKSPTYGYLREGTDYTVAYSNNVDATSAAVVTVTPIGNYTGGPLTKTFVIAQRSLKDYGVTVTVPDAVYNNGSEITLNETVYYGDTKLVRDRDYKVYISSYSVGTATATIEGYGNYKDTVAKTFTIVEKDKALSSGNTYVYIGGSLASSYAVSYNGSKQTPSVTVYVGATQQSSTVLSPSYYTVTYLDNDKPGTAKIIITGRNGYAGTVEANFRIDATQINQYNTTISGLSASYTYTGAYIAPEVTVRVNGVTLTKGKHYTVTYSNNKNISSQYSKARVTINAIHDSGYIGSVSQEFTIAGKSMYGCTASFAGGISSSDYKGTVVKPTIIVKDGYYTTLREYTDYTVSYKDASGKVVSSMKEAGTYTVVITGKGNYSGELTLTYTIKGKDISYYDVTLNKTSVKATGSSQKPTVTSVKYGSTALKSTDYSVSYQNSLGQTVTSMSAPGTYKVVVTGKGGYSGSTYATFTITGDPQTVTLNKGNVKVYKDSDPIKVIAKATGDGTGFIYTSSNPEVATVNAYGVVTIKSIGRAKITATTVGMKKSEEASASFVVKVYPDKATISKKPWTEGSSLRVRWDIQEDATYYEVRYSRDKSFKSGTYKTKKVTASEKYDTQSTRLADLKSGNKYYVKVRAVKVVYNDYGQELKYYGKWSGWRSAVTK